MAQAVSALPVVGISTALLTYAALGFALEADVVAMTVAYFDPQQRLMLVDREMNRVLRLTFSDTVYVHWREQLAVYL